uniref:MSP domain-containing protein n=1 Tax=Ditylenchus dipsaci TaxID=166011 RepID=A0A915D968_9BILA
MHMQFRNAYALLSTYCFVVAVLLFACFSRSCSQPSKREWLWLSNPPLFKCLLLVCLCSHADQFGESRLAFKVKSTNNDHYRLKPSWIRGAGQTAALEVTRTAGPPKEDKLVIQFLEVAVDVTDGAELFRVVLLKKSRCQPQLSSPLRKRLIEHNCLLFSVVTMNCK